MASAPLSLLYCVYPDHLRLFVSASPDWAPNQIAHRLKGQDLLARYPDQWIAIYNQAGVGSAEKFDDLLIALRQRDMPPEQTLVERLSRDDDVLILAHR